VLIETLLHGMNPEQQEAIIAPPGPVLVVAGPGSGKTSVLTRRVAFLIDQQNIPGYRIMAVTFTNKAAAEMRHRIDQLGCDSQGLSIGTFHATCARLLRKEIATMGGGYTSAYTIYDTDDQVSLIKQALDSLDISPKNNPPHGQLNRISNAKNELIAPDEYPTTSLPDKITQRVYARYQMMLRQNNALDFDDLIMLTVTLFRTHPEVLERYHARYEHILVDEFQDTNTAQYQLLRLIAGEHGSLFVVGDPDQSIYRFRGAVPHNVQQFRKDYDPVKLIRLGQNYRSHQLILDAATAVIRRNADHIPIDLTGQRRTGHKIVLHESLTETQEAQYIVEQIAMHVAEGAHPRDCAVMYRTNAQSRSIEEAFVRAGLPYRLAGGTRFYARKEIKDVLAYLRLIYNTDDTVSWQRVINTPPRGIGDKTLDQLEHWAAMRQETSFQAIRALTQQQADPISSPLSARAEKSLIEFVSAIDNWARLKETVPVSQLLEDVLSQTRYLDYLNDGTEEAQDRIENVGSLRSLAQDFGERPLTDFLEDVALVADAETRDDSGDVPTLLTLHAAKGLEYPIVFIAGLEEGTLPHRRALDDEEEMQEDRRLLYVGITRAKDIVYLTWVARRMLYGSSEFLMPSRFLADIPRELLEGTPPTRAASMREWQSYRELTSWESGSQSPTPARVSGSLIPKANGSPRVNGSAVINGATRGGSDGAAAFVPRAPIGKPATTSARQPIYRSGQRVTHEKFGEGTVITSAIRGEIEELEVRFADKRFGFKKLSADFVKPIRD